MLFGGFLIRSINFLVALYVVKIDTSYKETQKTNDRAGGELGARTASAQAGRPCKKISIFMEISILAPI